MMKLVLVIISSFLLGSVALAQHGMSQYDRVMGQVKQLSDSPYVRFLKSGQSTDGRAIPAFIITDFNKSSEHKTRVFICAGQHGDELNPVRSLISLCRELAAGKHAELLIGCVFIVVPMVNPGGIAADNRLSNDNTDINRDWMKLATPEAWFVDNLITQWKPHVLIDLHEWMEPIQGAANCIEIARASSDRQIMAMSDTAQRAVQNAGLSAIYCSEDSNPALFHRRYTSKGYAAYLIETAYGETYVDKDRSYRSAVLSLASGALTNPRSRQALSPASVDFDLEAVSGYLKPRSRLLTVSMLPYTAVILGIGCFLMLWLHKLHTNGDETKWDRKLTRCLVDSGLDTTSLRSRRSPQPLTSKSWVNRRLRSRYSNTRRRGLGESASHISAQ